MTKLTTGSAIVKSLLANHIDTLFCLPGVQNDHFFNAIYDEGDAFRTIHTRHEQGAGYMALGAALATGKPTAYSIVPGPGFLNSSAALATAYSTNAKVLCLSGQIPSRGIGKNYGMLHEIRDQLGIMRTMTKWAGRINSASEAPGLINEAFRQMHTGRPRPVGLECPMDVLPQQEEVALLKAEENIERPAINEDEIKAAVKLLVKAKRPLIYVGSGAMDAAAEVTAIAEALQAPVTSFRTGNGIVDRRHYLSQSTPAGHRLWRDADLVLGIGTRLQVAQMAWGVDEDLKIIRIDVDNEEIDRINKPDVAIVGDAKSALTMLLGELETNNVKRPSIKDEMHTLKQEFETEFSKLGPQMAYINAIRSELPEEGVFVDELTQVGFVSRFAFPAYRPRTFISTGYQGNLGWGFATALGVKAALPDTPVVSVSGDGGFMYNVQELATAVLHKIDLVTIVFNNNAYGNVMQMQEDLYDNRVIASHLHNPDFVKLAENFGARGVKAETPEALGSVLREAFKINDQPTLIEVPVGKMPSPWHLIDLPKIR